MRVLALTAVMLTGLFASAGPAECVYCPSYTCYGPCLQGCLCITQPGETGGKCYGVQLAERLLAAGAVEIR